MPQRLSLFIYFLKYMVSVFSIKYIWIAITFIAVVQEAGRDTKVLYFNLLIEESLRKWQQTCRSFYAIWS